jgi:hypothetical protein
MTIDPPLILRPSGFANKTEAGVDRVYGMAAADARFDRENCRLEALYRCGKDSRFI